MRSRQGAPRFIAFCYYRIYPLIFGGGAHTSLPITMFSRFSKTEVNAEKAQKPFGATDICLPAISAAVKKAYDFIIRIYAGSR